MMNQISIGMRLLAWLEENVLRVIVRIGAVIADAAGGRAVVVAEVVDAAADPVAVVDGVGTVGLGTRTPATDLHRFTRIVLINGEGRDLVAAFLAVLLVSKRPTLRTERGRVGQPVFGYSGLATYSVPL